jgi:dihydrofolate reductase
MFGPIRGPWGSDQWTGWWGENPLFHYPVFVLTHHSRPSITMRGGTTFHFVDDGIKAALTRALDAADGDDVRVGGGAATIQEYLREGLIDELHLVVVPILLGGGERSSTTSTAVQMATSASSSSAHPRSLTFASGRRSRQPLTSRLAQGRARRPRNAGQ